MKLLFPALSLLFFAVTVQSGCSPDESSTQESDTTHATNVVPDQAGINSGIIPDSRFVLAEEVISDYGPGNITRDVLQDQNGNIWLASWEGIVKYDGKQFTNMTRQEGLHHNAAYSLLEDSKGILWFGTMGAGVYRYDGTSFKNINQGHGLVNNFVMCIFEDDAGNTWFGTATGASRYDGKSFMNVGESAGLTGSVNAISQDTSGVMWIGTNAGLFRYDMKTVTPVLTDHETPWMNVRDIKCDSKGVMWIGCPSGLYKSVPSPNGEPHLTLVRPEFTSYIREDHEGNLLLTADGIYRYDGAKFDTIATDKNSLGIFGAIEDKQGNVWWGAMDGLHKYDGKTTAGFAKRRASVSVAK